MSKRIKNFDDFINESYNPSRIDEGFLSILKNYAKRFFGWTGKFLRSLVDGLIEPIPYGPKKGLPTVMLFLPENGSIYKQMAEFERGVNPLKEARIPLEYTGEDQSVRNISADQLKQDVIRLYRSKQRGGRAKPIFIYGAPGIGKTEIVGQAADELGVAVEKLDLQFMNPEDFLGIPSKHDIEPVQVEDGKLISPGKGFTRSNPPILLPTDNGPANRGGIIFMDEMNRANKAVLNSIMQFVQKGEIGPYRLPDKWIIVAAGNRPEEAEGVADFDFALADRFTIKNYVPTIEGYSKWADKNEKILPELVTFLTFNPIYFHNLDVDKKSLNYPTPRSWTDGALILHDEIMDKGADSWRDISRQDILDIFYDQVGPEAAGKFVAYLDILRKVSDSDMDNMINNPMSAVMIPEAQTTKSVLYGLIEMIMKRVRNYDTQKLYNTMEYFNRYGEIEPLSWLYKDIISKYPQFKFSGTSSNSEDELKHKAAIFITKGAKDKGLQG
ncbi:MAG: AAA family ATPase [Spirochaetia bacterium]|nr:AAA family ATPase [Spirochaetia bacterium]